MTTLTLAAFFLMNAALYKKIKWKERENIQQLLVEELKDKYS